MDDNTRPEDGHCLGSDGLVHVFVKSKLLCAKGHFPGLVGENALIVTDHANCPVCVIAARKRIEDLINPPEKKPEEYYQQITQAAISAQIANLQAMRAINQNINVGNTVANQAITAQAKAQADAQHKLFESGLLSKLSNLIPFSKKKE